MRRVRALRKRADAQISFLTAESTALITLYLVQDMTLEARNVVHDLALLSKEIILLKNSTKPREIFLLIEKIKEERKLVALEMSDLEEISCQIISRVQ